MSFPQRRGRTVSPAPKVAGPQKPGGRSAAAHPLADQENNAHSQSPAPAPAAAAAKKPEIVPSILVTPEAAQLISKMSESSDAYRSIFAKVESAVMHGVMKGVDEKSIVAECKRLLEQNPLVEMGEVQKL